MALHVAQREKMSDFEREEFEQEKTVVQMQLEHAQKLKNMDYEVSKIEARWTVLFKLPSIILSLPVKLLLAIGYIVSMITKHPDEKFWDNIWKN
jgi:hypothetical protein